MAAAVHIRPLRPDDEPAWRDLWRAYLAFYDSAVEEAVYRSSFARLSSGAPGEFRGLIAEVEGTPVGLAHFLFHRHGWKIEDVCYLQDLYVAPQWRGHHIGRALIEAVYAAADTAGAPQVYWVTQEGNATARRLYDRLARNEGFIKYARAPAAAEGAR